MRLQPPGTVKCLDLMGGGGGGGEELEKWLMEFRNGLVI